MVHKNNMTAWDEITCQRGHAPDEHQRRLVPVDLALGHGYHDLPRIPERLIPPPFRMLVWDPDAHPVDGGPYCPAHDAVSETIVSHKVWEPRESILWLDACRRAPADAFMIDMGAQIGWFTLLAAVEGRHVVAYEADASNAELLRASLHLNALRPRVIMSEQRIGPGSVPLDLPRLAPVAAVKIDLEGAERDAIQMLWPLIEAGQVDRLLVEISPVFADYYPALVARIMDVGCRAHLLPPKSSPAADMVDLEASLIELDRDGVEQQVASWHQEDVWFIREGASW